MELETISFLSVRNIGDLMAAMAGIKKVCTERNKQAVIYQRLNMKANYYNGAIHPTKDDNGVQVCFNKVMFEMVKPLIEAQYYVKDFKVWQGEETDFDLENIGRYKVGMPNFDLRRWYFQVYPQMATDLSKQWIHTPISSDTIKNNKVVINRTQRYTNPIISFYFLKDYQDKVIFSGTKEEHQLFCNEWNLDIPYLEVNNFLELAVYLTNCKFFIGNQSFAYNLAEGLKVPRVLELCEYAPNCIVQGKDGYDFLHQTGLEYYFKKFINQ